MRKWSRPEFSRRIKLITQKIRNIDLLVKDQMFRESSTTQESKGLLSKPNSNGWSPLPNRETKSPQQNSSHIVGKENFPIRQIRQKMARFAWESDQLSCSPLWAHAPTRLHFSAIDGKCRIETCPLYFVSRRTAQLCAVYECCLSTLLPEGLRKVRKAEDHQGGVRGM